MRVMPIRGLILHMGDIDRDPPLPLLRRLVNHVKRRKRRRRISVMQRLRDRRRQRRLPMINMTHRANVQMRLIALELRLTHGGAREPFSVMRGELLLAADAGDDFFLNGVRHLLVRLELHAVHGTPLGP